MLRSLCHLLALVSLASGAAEAQAPSYPAARPELIGTWELNESLSDDLPLLPGDAVAEARASGRLPSVSLRRRGRKGLDLHQALRVRTAVRDAFDAAARLAVVHTADTFVVTDNRGESLSFVPDGASRATVTAGDVPFDVLARWETAALIVERRYPDGTVLTDRFATFAEPRQLAVTTTVVNPRIDEPAVTVLRVYDPVR